MTNTKICDWLMDNADAPIRYRAALEFLKDKKTAKTIEPVDIANEIKSITENIIQNYK